MVAIFLTKFSHLHGHSPTNLPARKGVRGTELDVVERTPGRGTASRLGRAGLALSLLLVLLRRDPDADPGDRHQWFHRVSPGLPAECGVAGPRAAVPLAYPQHRRCPRPVALARIVAGLRLFPGLRAGVLPERHLHPVRVERGRGLGVPCAVFRLVDGAGLPRLRGGRRAALDSHPPGLLAETPRAIGEPGGTGRHRRLPGGEAGAGEPHVRHGPGQLREAHGAGGALAARGGLPSVPPATGRDA